VYTPPHGCDHPNDLYTDEVSVNTAPVHKNILSVITNITGSTFTWPKPKMAMRQNIGKLSLGYSLRDIFIYKQTNKWPTNITTYTFKKQFLHYLMSQFEQQGLSHTMRRSLWMVTKELKGGIIVFFKVLTVHSYKRQRKTMKNLSQDSAQCSISDTSADFTAL
jgi:hypothetical protein